MKNILVIDDLRTHPDPGVVHARTSADALDALQSGTPWDEVWFDHDLGGEDDVRRVVLWVEEHRPDIGHCYVQSMNPVGSKWIRTALERSGYSVSVAFLTA